MSIAQLRAIRNQRHEAAAKVAEQLALFEADLDRALVSGGHLLSLLPAARADAEMSPTVGHRAIDQVGSALAMLSQAMTRTATAHRSLDETRQHFRLPVRAGGDKDDIPPPKSIETAAPDALRVVAG